MEFNVFQDRTPLIAVLEKEDWKLYRFEEILLDDTKNAVKIKKENYLENGRCPIIDQGQSEIAGYTNNENGVYETKGSIIFGDHTRSIKYIDFPMFLGADGVKLLKCKLEQSIVDMKYVYYFLKTIELPSDGYSRHFKYLKEVIIPIPSLEIQEKIVAILDKAGQLIDKRKEQIEACDELVKSQFIEMFGDPVSNPMEWNKMACKKTTSKIGSGATPKGGNESYKEEGIALIRSMNVQNDRFEYKELAHIDEQQADKLNNVTIEENDVLLNITGASVARCCVVPQNILPARVNQHVSILRCKEVVMPTFMCHQLINGNYQKLLWNIATSSGATREAITKQQIEDLEIIVPPLYLQNQFSKFVQQVDKVKLGMQSSLTELENNFHALMQKSFKGELFK